jgi:hypothetical protein
MPQPTPTITPPSSVASDTQITAPSVTQSGASSQPQHMVEQQNQKLPNQHSNPEKQNEVE